MDCYNKKMNSMTFGKIGAYALGTATGIYALGSFIGAWFLDVETYLSLVVPMLGIYWFLYHFQWKKHVGRNMPPWMSYTSGCFIVVFVLWLARGMLYEPVRIPSESMRPNLIIGDVLLINRHAYFWKLPGTSWVIADVRKPQVGEAIVFRAPFNNSMHLIKRVMATAGQEIVINRVNQQVVVDGNIYPVRNVEKSDFGNTINELDIRPDELALMEKIGDRWHPVLYSKKTTAELAMTPNAENMQTWKHACSWTAEWIRCKVPAGYFFAMGDNRDYSADSRTWGFAAEKDIVGAPAILLFNNNNWFGRKYSYMQ